MFGYNNSNLGTVNIKDTAFIAQLVFKLKCTDYRSCSETYTEEELNGGDIIYLENIYFIRRSSTKYNGYYRYHIITACLQQSDEIIVFKSDYYLAVNSETHVVKAFPFIIKLQFIDDPNYSSRFIQQFTHTVDVSRILYNKIAVIQDDGKTLNGQSKNLFRGSFDKRSVVGTIIPFIQGKDLHQALIDRDIDILSLSEKGRLVLDLLYCVKIIHDQEELHGDIKLANVIYQKDSLRKLVLIDLDSVNKERRMLFHIASPGFTAPESYHAGQSPPYNETRSSDIYSTGGVIGCIFFGPEFAYCHPNKKEMIRNPRLYAYVSQFISYDFEHAKRVIEKERSEQIQSALSLIYDYLYTAMCGAKLENRKYIDQPISFFDFIFQQYLNGKF